MSSTDLLPYLQQDPIARALGWAQLPDDERRRRAMAAAAAHDGPALAELADAFLTLRGQSGAHVSAHTRRAYRTGVLALVEGWQHENLLRPGQEAGSAWVRRLEGAGASPATVRVRLAAARLLYRALRWARATNADPFADAQAARELTPPWEKRTPYAAREIEALLAATGAWGSLGQRDRVMVLLGAHAGLRVAEACALAWEDIDLDSDTLFVRSGKGGKGRRVALSRSLRAALVDLWEQPPPQHARDLDRVLPLTEGVVRERMVRLAAEAGVPYRGFHALRHAAGTRAAREGLGLDAIAAFLGHANIQTTRTYQHWADERVRTTISAW